MSFTTVYLTEDIELTESEIATLERSIGREIGLGNDFVNIYSRDRDIIQAFIDLVGEHYIAEIPEMDDLIQIVT